MKIEPQKIFPLYGVAGCFGRRKFLPILPSTLIGKICVNDCLEDI